MNKHTPGPWKLAADEGTFVYALNADEVNSFWLSVQPGFIGGMERTSLEEIRANARLIAAAPDLLDALRDLAELFEIPGEGSIVRFDRIAELYNRETGYYAPGKDVAAAANDDASMEDRRAWYEAWYAARVASARAAIAKATV